MYNDNNIERRLNTFIQVSKNITSNESLKELIQEIIEEVIESIEKADAGFLILWNEEKEYLEIEAAVNFKEEMYLCNKLLKGEGISGSVFADGQSRLINSVDNIEKAMSNMRNKTLQYYLKSTVHALMPISCLSVPLTHQNQKIGVLTIDNFKNEGFFTKEDLRFLEAIGNQIAITIVNARAFQEKQQRAIQLETILHLHNQLNEAVLNGKGMQSLVESLATNVEGSIYYFDSLCRLEVSYQPSKENIPLLIKWLKGHMKELRSQQLHSIFNEQIFIGQALSVRSSFGTIGFLVITGKVATLDTVGELGFKHAASIIAIEQIKLQEQIKHRQAEKELLLTEILNRNFTSDVQASLKKYGMITAKNYVFLAIKSAHHLFEDINQMVSFEELLKRIFGKKYYVMTFPHNDKIYLLLGTKESMNDKLDEIKMFGSRLQSIYNDAHIYIGRTVQSLRHIPISFHDVKMMADGQFKDGGKKGKIFTFRFLGYKRYLLNVPDEEGAHFVENILGPILYQSNRTGKNDLLYTLKIYLDFNKNTVQTAEAMHLHPNTVYYRLQQLQEKLDCDFDNLEDLTNLKTALFLHEKK
ncbi:helix-turn-helix domain-containing protein [Cytobacillus purgationiresistens]|uniref:Sugar diacid utilization regulator n=1 Tax=Cytobacillus purgationiresistens TaxID=863449 RepID=A0ABU0AMX4_9BACI|nr:helix-turn-helix domain-containing protein [Cytobacillus purgationiresistens]MDQ0271400.1 sugar diacid utilization regulator [Cytobacillus purgationiresistens]